MPTSAPAPQLTENFRLESPRDSIRGMKSRSCPKRRRNVLVGEECPFLKRLPKLGTRSTCYSTAGNGSNETMQTSIERQSKA